MEIMGHKTPDHAPMGDDSHGLCTRLCDLIHDRNGPADHICSVLPARIRKILLHGSSGGKKVCVALHNHIVGKSLQITEGDLPETFPDDPRRMELFVDNIGCLTRADQITGPYGVDGFFF